MGNCDRQSRHREQAFRTFRSESPFSSALANEVVRRTIKVELQLNHITSSTSKYPIAAWQICSATNLFSRKLDFHRAATHS